MTDNNLSEGFAFSSATANVRAYQAKLLEMAQANMAFCLGVQLEAGDTSVALQVFQCHSRIHR